MVDLDPRLYGHAPVELEPIDGEVYLTMVGVLKKLQIGEWKLRQTPELMAMRKVLGTRTHRWLKSDIDAYMRRQHQPAVQLTRKERKRRLLEWDERRRKGKTIPRSTPRNSELAAKLAAYHGS